MAAAGLVGVIGGTGNREGELLMGGRVSIKARGGKWLALVELTRKAGWVVSLV
jgi:hypothetical protein